MQIQHDTLESDFLKRLRNDTASEHKSAEKVMPVLDPSFERGDYLKLLSVMYGFYRPLEAGLGSFFRAGSDPFAWQKRTKLALLHADLRALGLTDEQIEHIPNNPRPPPHATLPERIGTLYVLEGSTLGGSMIARHLSERWGVTLPLQFFRSYGTNTGPMWKDFQNIARSLITEENYSDVLRAAIETFTRLREWMIRDSGPTLL